MPQATLTLYGLSNGTNAEQFKQKLAGLYNLPEEKFEAACTSVLVNGQPYVLISKITQLEADKHKKRLVKLGFICDEVEESAKDESGLALTPVDAIQAVDVECPACDQSSGGGDICEQCGVVISKYLEHKTFDDQLQSQLKSSSYSQERMQEIRTEKTIRENQKEKTIKLKKVAGAKKKGTPKSDSNSTTASVSRSSAEERQVSVHSDVSTSKKLYAVVASVCLTIFGAGFIAYTVVENPSSKQDVVAKSDSNNTGNGLGSTSSLIAADSSVKAQEELIPETVFDFQTIHQRELNDLEIKLGNLYEENMNFSIAHMISTKEDPRERIFANQAMIKLENAGKKSAEKLEEVHAMLGNLDQNIDRVQMLLNHAGIYNYLELPLESGEFLQQANRIALEIKDSESQIMAKVALAQFQTLHGDMEEARASYQQAKIQSAQLNPQSLVDSAYSFIAMSEASHGLSNQARSTGELITAEAIKENTNQHISQFSKEVEKTDQPELAAAQDVGVTGDQLLDDLKTMTKQNKKKLKAVSSLLGQ